MNIQNSAITIMLLGIFVVAYGIVLSRIDLSSPIMRLFNNDIFRILFLSVFLIYGFKKTPHIAVIVAIVFVMSMHFLSRLEIEEKFKNIKI